MDINNIISVIKQKRDEYNNTCELYFKDEFKRSEAPYYYTKMRTADEILLAIENYIRENRQGKQVYRNQNIKMKAAIIYSVFFLSALISTVGLVTTINEYPNFAIIFAAILTLVLTIMGIKKFLDDRRIKQGERVGGTGIGVLSRGIKQGYRVGRTKM